MHEILEFSPLGSLSRGLTSHTQASCSHLCTNTTGNSLPALRNHGPRYAPRSSAPMWPVITGPDCVLNSPRDRRGFTGVGKWQRHRMRVLCGRGRSWGNPQQMDIHLRAEGAQPWEAGGARRPGEDGLGLQKPWEGSLRDPGPCRLCVCTGQGLWLEGIIWPLGAGGQVPGHYCFLSTCRPCLAF